METVPKPRTCPHCGKAILRLPKKPRDLGLLLHVLLYRVPKEKPITEPWIEVARKHCHMKPERLAELRAEPHARHWRRMEERRAARLAYFKQHGELPPLGMPLLPGEPDRSAQIDALYRYRKGGLAKLKARMRKRPEADRAKLANRFAAMQRIRSPSRRLAALDDVVARLLANLNAGKMSLAEYEALQSMMLPDRPSARKAAAATSATGSEPGAAEKKGAGRTSA
jgi:hypothetical protein